MSVILTLQRRRQEDSKFKSSLDYETQNIKIIEDEEEEQLLVGGSKPLRIGCLSGANAVLGSLHTALWQ